MDFFILDGKDCPSEYQSIKYHTACLESSIYLAKSGLSDTIKDSIVDLHNNWRLYHIKLEACGNTFFII